ncbi:MAG: MarR family transcriptional regulator [Proteobacteria bacterium]|nr:MarR family transcriptional regulator [Pseudomonadota bacterium]
MASARLNQPLTMDDMLLYVLWIIQTHAGRAMVQLCEAEFGMSRREWRVLAHLAGQEGLQPSELALRAGLDRARISRALTGLVQKGLVRRVPRPGDRREVMLQLTDDGHAVYARLLPRVAHIQGRLLSALSQEEVGQLSDLLGRVALQARAMGAALAPGDDA